MDLPPLRAGLSPQIPLVLKPQPMQPESSDAAVPPKTRIIFLSAVTREFHATPLGQEYSFPSYRGVLQAAFLTLGKHYKVTVQEEFAVGPSDLLLMLDDEISESHLVIHLVGDKAGVRPVPASLRALHERLPQLLARQPELQQALGDGAGISYTQWECYLALHHKKHLFVFEKESNTPVSPSCDISDEDRASQEAHRRRIEISGQHWATFANQGDLVRKAVRSFLHFHLDPEIDPMEPAADLTDRARTETEEIIQALCTAIKNPDARAVPVTDPANAAAWVAAVRAAAKRWQVNLRTIVDIAVRYEGKIAAAAGHSPTFDSLYDLAFANLALGDYTAAHFNALRAADLSLELRKTRPLDDEEHRRNAINALLLASEAAKASRDVLATISAQRRAGELIDKEKEPVLWADTHEPLADFLLDQAQWNQAEELINDMVDIREEYQGENHPDLARTLLLWSHLLYNRANWFGMESVAARAERIFAAQNPPDLSGIAAALSERAMALHKESRFAEAEPLMRQALAIWEKSLGMDHPTIATALNNLAALLSEINRLAEAERLYRRALAIWERSFGESHPLVATALDNLAALLNETNRPAEAEPLMRKSLTIREQSFGQDHPDVATSLNNLAALLSETNRLAEAEPLKRRALAIWERSFGESHPLVATALDNLAALLSKTNRLAEAEPLVRNALAIREHRFGKDHPTIFEARINLIDLLIKLNRFEEAEQMTKEEVETQNRIHGSEHPDTATAMQYYGDILRIHRKNHQAAETIYRKVLSTREKLLPKDHNFLSITINNLASLLEKDGGFQEAALLRQRVLETQERTLGSEHPDTLRSWNNQSYALRKQGHAELAEPIDRKVAATTAKVLGDTNPLTIHRYNNLLLTLIMLDKLEEARQILAANWRLNAPPHANTTPRIAFLCHLIALLELQSNTPFLGQFRTLLTGPELPVSSDVAVPWDIAYFIEFLKPKLGEHNAKLLTALVAALNDRAQLPALDQFPEWRNQPAIPLD